MQEPYSKFTISNLLLDENVLNKINKNIYNKISQKKRSYFLSTLGFLVLHWDDNDVRQPLCLYILDEDDEADHLNLISYMFPKFKFIVYYHHNKPSLDNITVIKYNTDIQVQNNMFFISDKIGNDVNDLINKLNPDHVWIKFNLNILSNLIEKGFDPVLIDSVRTQKEADANAKKGTGIAKSLHLYGAAGDIISGSKGRKDNKFNAALILESKRLGLTSGANKKYGGDFPTKHDVAHVQAIPIKLQSAFRSLVTVAARDAFIANYFKSQKGGILNV